MSKFSLDRYDFSFPENLIAQKPVSPRDSARLMVYDRKEKRVALDTFTHLGRYLPPRSVLVINETKVVPARLAVHKATGGRVKLLFLRDENGFWEVLSDRKLKIGEVLSIDSTKKLVVKKQAEAIFYLQPSFPISQTFRLLETFGETPIPPYIKHSPLSEKKLRGEYQAVFAKKKGSVAAPTASLHFTKKLIQSLEKQGHSVVRLVLHVGLGTFSPVTEEQMKTKKLHHEFYEITPRVAEFLEHAKKEGRAIIPVGTTALRALESAAKGGGKFGRLSGETDLFIQEGYKFKFTSGLITNFHVPRSSLLMLVSALASQREIMNLYRLAVEEKFRLFSFGDGMLIF